MTRQSFLCGAETCLSRKWINLNIKISIPILPYNFYAAIL